MSHEVIGAQKDTDNENFRDFRRRLFHGSITMIHKPLEPFMHEWDVIQCSDHHFRRAIYGIGPHIADYPEQTAAAGIVYGWCVMLVYFSIMWVQSAHITRCDAKPDDLDDPTASLRTREQTTTLLKDKDPESLWYDHGIIPDFQVRHHGTGILV